MRPCPACGSETAKAVGARNGFELERCDECDTLFTGDLPESEEAAEDYSSYYHAGNLDVPAFVERRLGELVAHFEPYRVRNRWLDVGCGAGALVRAAEQRGWEGIGTEIAAGAVEAARSNGLDVRLGELDELAFEPGSFDVVSLVEVIEHVPNPAGLIGSASLLVRPGGGMYVTTPHGRGISARLLRDRWSVVSPPEHLQLFSVRGIRAMLSRAALEPEAIRTEAVNPRELVAALRRREGVGGGERVESSYRLNESLSARGGGRLLKGTVNGALNALRLGDALKATARKRGSGSPLP